MRQNGPIRRLIDEIAPDGDSCRWHPMYDYPATGYCEIAETDYDDNTDTHRRLIVRRVCLLDDKQEPLFPHWDHHAFITNRTGLLNDEDLHHRAHAVCELAIRDLKPTGCATARPDGSTPTPPGSASRPSPTTSPAGRSIPPPTPPP